MIDENRVEKIGSGAAGYDPRDDYRPAEIEAGWRSKWAESGLYRTPDIARTGGEGRRKFYCLDFFPYPSGAGLSVGHGRNYVPSDVISRYYRMSGYAVLHPMGWDAFGLPAENEAIKRGIHPAETTARYSANYKRQMDLIGCSYDWEREINSSNPEFYRWTQWFFLLLYRRGLAYRAMGRQWWCPGCKTVLANEQVNADGTCWRGHAGVYKRDLEQWYFRITAYADQLLDDLATLDWPEHILQMQREWIGRSEGIEFGMAVEGTDARLSVFTTRPDTIGGVTFAVLAPEHPLIDAITTPERRAAVASYREDAARRSEVERQREGRERDGVFTGAYAVNPANGRRVPVYVADYVLGGYGSGAIMAVPAHDERDYDFARRHDIPIVVSVAPAGWRGEELRAAYTGPGTLVNSGAWDGLPSDEGGRRIAGWLEEQGIGRRTAQYRLRDWLISRQRYWGAPIPIVYCDGCGMVPVREAEVPVLLPAMTKWLPGEGGRSPLANAPEFVNTTCPECGGSARRETDTMDGFACSSWYSLRFVSPHYAEGPFDPAALARWGTPDLYVGGAEHARMHLLYARMWTKVMADAGLVPFREPFPVLRSQGTMHARDADGGIRRMSKSRGNVVTPDAMAERYGADALRIYLLFMAPFENNTVWDEEGMWGARRFLARTWRLVEQVRSSPPPARFGGEAAAAQALRRAAHRTIRRVTEEVERLQFNTAVAALMEHLNRLIAYHAADGASPELAEAVRDYVVLLAPFAPFIAEEMWQRMHGRDGGQFAPGDSVHGQPWPAWDPAVAIEQTVALVVQVDGKVRGRVAVEPDISETEARARSLADEGVQRALGGREVARAIYVPGRLLNLVTKP